METFYEIKPGLLKASAVALGFFDGVHPGHQAVIKLAVESSAKLNIPSAVATFKDHPRHLTQGQPPALLSSFEQRLECFAALGVDLTLALTFTDEICQLSAEDYVHLVLISCLGARSISVGYNHRFGCNRTGTPELLTKLGPQLGFTVNIAPEVIASGNPLSSSTIRNALQEGDLHLANELLGRTFELNGIVIHGDGHGVKLGFPTANLQVSEHQLLPKLGVYAGKTVVDDKLWNCVINIGYRPTISNQKKLSVEVHLLNYSGNLYEKRLAIQLLEYIRPEKKFADIAALKTQISADCLTASKLLCNTAPSK